MTRELVLIHGRSQQHKDAGALKQDWLGALGEGLAKSGLSLPIEGTAVHFPYYGDTLYDLVDGKSDDDAARVIVRGTDTNEEERAFVLAIIEEMRAQRGITDAEVAEIAGQQAVDKGPLNWGWLQAVLETMDKHLPGTSSTSIALFTHDVYLYLKNSAIRQVIEEGVSNAITPGVETVVVSHSLGTVVAYNLIRREGASRGWQVPQLVTVGSPLAIHEIRRTLKRFDTIRCPEVVSAWFNAYDPRDVVALFPLDVDHFELDPTKPSIVNKGDVQNKTDNRHGIAGYLDDKDVARQIYDALTGP